VGLGRVSRSLPPRKSKIFDIRHVVIVTVFCVEFSHSFPQNSANVLALTAIKKSYNEVKNLQDHRLMRVSATCFGIVPASVEHAEGVKLR